MEEELSQSSTIQNMLNQSPLVKFSLYTQILFQALNELEIEIIQKLDERQNQTAYNKFLFWVLGSYEIVRTMIQAKDCFDKEPKSDYINLKVKSAKFVCL